MNGRPTHLKETISIPAGGDYSRPIFLTLGERVGSERNYCVACANPLLTHEKTGESFCPECEPESLPKNIHASNHPYAKHCPTCATPLLYSIGSAKHKTRFYFCPHCVEGQYSHTMNVAGLVSNTDENNAVIHLDAEQYAAQGYDDRDDESIGGRHRGKHKQSMKDRRDESKGMTSHDNPHHPYSDVSTMSAELTGSQYYPVGEGHILGDITSDAQYTPLGSNAEEFAAQGYDDRDDESIGGRHRGKHKQSLKDRRDESKGMTNRWNRHHPYSDVSTMSAEYDSPYGERQTTTFGLVGGGNDFAQNRAESLMDTTSDEVMPFGVIGGGNDFGQNLAEDFASDHHLTEAERNRLPKSDFAMPSERKYPMPNTYYAKKALTYAKWPNNRGDLREVERNVLDKYPSLDGWWSKHRPKNAETFGAESRGTTMWMTAAMAAIGFVAGLSFKDMNSDIDTQEE